MTVAEDEKGDAMNRQRYGILILFTIIGILLGILLVWGWCRGGEKKAEERYEPIVVDRFATPFAVAEVKPGQAGCQLSGPLEALWALVPRIPSRAHAQKQDPQQDPQQNPPQPSQTRQSGPRDPGFCVYRWRNDKKLPTAEDFKGIDAVPDSPVLGTSPGTSGEIPKLPASVSGPLMKLFERRARGFDRSRWQSLLGRLKTGSMKPVKVAVVDATPKSLNEVDASTHGFAVSRVIGTLLCADVDSDACRQQVVPYLALPIIAAAPGDFTVDLANGGRAGTFFQLHDAISLALEQWNPAQENLVINLSLGWDPIKTDPGDKNVLRIRSLLERASCMGALVVAAAGNFSGSANPVFPAAFGSLKAPTDTECERSGIRKQPAPRIPGDGAPVPTADVYRPLVHAVGAVDARDQRLTADRRWGQPPLAAFGLAVTVPGPRDNPKIPYTPPLNGTSMSAAVASGVAAAVWSVRPDLQAAEVMAFVHQGGARLDGGTASRRASAEFCVGEPNGPCRGTALEVHRAFVCGALSLLLPKENLICDTKPLAVADMPQWGSSAPTGTPIGACGVTECGIPTGPSSTQLPAGTVPHGGFASCPSCTLNVDFNSGLGFLGGDVIVDSSISKILSAVLNTDWGQSFPLSPVPTYGGPMAFPPVAGIWPNTTGAHITWTYKFSGRAFSSSEPSELIVWP
jgi:hypothetical protein